MDIQFLPGERAMLLDKTLVISDIHVGIEYEFRKSGIKMPSQTQEMRKRLDSLLEKTKATSLVICGDFKHKVPGTTRQEEKEIPKFLEHFSRKTRVEIALGNHDADLPQLSPKKIKLHPTKGFLSQNIYYTHGHTWPSPDFLKAEYLVTGHIQPQVEIKDSLGYIWREPVWVRAKLSRKRVRAAFPKIPMPVNLPELIIIPSFNPMAGGLAINRFFPKSGKKPTGKKKKIRESPILKLADLRSAEIFLLDGTFLGELKSL